MGLTAPNVEAHLMRPYVLAVDPGLATGVALIDSATLQPEYIWEGQWKDTIRKIAESMRDYETDLVVEKFTITTQTAKHSAAPWSLEMIGVVRSMAWQYGIISEPEQLILQSPGDAKAFTDNPKLRRMGWWVKGSKGHGHDAARHAALYLLRSGVRAPILLE